MDPAADSDTNPRAVNWVEDDIISDPDWNPKSFSCCDEDITPWADALVKNDDVPALIASILPLKEPVAVLNTPNSVFTEPVWVLIDAV